MNKDKEESRKGKIIFINAEDEFKEAKRRKYLEDKHIQRIVETYRCWKIEKQYSTVVSQHDIKDSNLLTSRYLEKPYIFMNSLGTIQILKEDRVNYGSEKPLKEVIEGTFRGMNISSQNAEEGEGPFKIIKLSDVQDGEILMDDLMNVSLKRKVKTEMYKVREGDLILSSRGASIKLAVVPKHDGEILLSHNFIGIRCGNLINPYYLQAYLESPIGQYYLMLNQSGTSVLTMNPKDIQEIPIRMISIIQQAKIAEDYQKLRNEYYQRLKELEQMKIERTLDLYEQMGIRQDFELIKE